MIQNTNYGASKTYVNTKVDKLTTSGLKAYTHDGATQGEIDVSNTYTPSTLALRDSNGRLFAADPASGATDKSLITANWVSQTGAGKPNNLLHDTGDETKTGVTTTERGNYSILIFKNTTYDVNNPTPGEHLQYLDFRDANGTSLVSLRIGVGSNGKTVIGYAMRNADGTTKYGSLATGN